jgi:hypothetical protein
VSEHNLPAGEAKIKRPSAGKDGIRRKSRPGHLRSVDGLYPARNPLMVGDRQRQTVNPEPGAPEAKQK